jgi:HSP20 family protein
VEAGAEVIAMFGLRKWDPFTELSTIHRDVDELFRRTFVNIAPGFLRGQWYPSVESYMKGDKLTVRVDLPGIDPEFVDISIVGNQLTIKGDRKMGTEEKEGKEYFCEVFYGSFERTLTLPEGVEVDKIHAGYHDGVLEITMPAKGVALPKKIHIKAEGEKKEVKTKAA